MALFVWFKFDGHHSIMIGKHLSPYPLWLRVNNVRVMREMTIDPNSTSLLNPLYLESTCNLLASYSYDQSLLA